MTDIERIPLPNQEGMILHALDGRVHMIHLRISSKELADTLITALSVEELASVLFLAWGIDGVEKFTHVLRCLSAEKKRHLVSGGRKT